METKEVHRFYLLYSQIGKLFGISPMQSDFLQIEEKHLEISATASNFSEGNTICATASHKLIEKMVEYAIAGMDNNLFVSTYMLQLPDKATLEKFLCDEMQDELSLKQLYRIPDNANEELANKTFVGIDFGTSTTVVSVAFYNTEEKRIECKTLHLQQKLRDGASMTAELLPSVIAIGNSGGFLVGQGAYQLKGNPDYIFGKNIWHSFKMELGENMGPRWTSITNNQLIKSPQDATTVFFRYLKWAIEKSVSENNLPTDIRYAVSIPASFESNQRLDLLQALYNNGIEIDGGTLIDEPNAAFISYITHFTICRTGRERHRSLYRIQLPFA